MIPILINKDVFEPNYNELKIMVQNRHYACTNLSEVKSLSRVQLFATPWTVDYQAPPSMGFSRQECWRGLP